MKRSLVAMVAILCTLMVACSRESKQERSVQTTTENRSTTAPPSQDMAKRDKALVRVVHAMPGQPAVDVFAGDSPTFSNVTYKTVTPYAELSDIRQRLTLKAAGQAATLAENSENFSAGRHYTLVAMFSAAKDAKPELRVLSDDLTPPNGKARVRFINAAPDAGEVDVYRKDKSEKLFKGVNYKSEAGYTEIDPAATSVELRPEGKKQALLTLPQFNFEPDKTYTIVMMGRAKSHQLDAVTVEDHFVGSYARN